MALSIPIKWLSGVAGEFILAPFGEHRGQLPGLEAQASVALARHPSGPLGS